MHLTVRHSYHQWRYSHLHLTTRVCLFELGVLNMFSCHVFLPPSYDLWTADIDECTRDTDRCHANANCHNTEGSYTCSCNSGYTGDGFSCNSKFIYFQSQQLLLASLTFSVQTLDINECLNNNGSCPHTCYDLDGSYTCSCSNGYLLIGDGQICEGRYLLTIRLSDIETNV